MPLIFADSGKNVMIQKITGKSEVKLFLEKLGFTVGSPVTVISSTVQGDLIVQVRDSRIALSRDMAKRIMV